MNPVSIAEGSVVKLRGEIRSYTGIVIKSAPNRIWLRIGEDWEPSYVFDGTKWIGVPPKAGHEAPKSEFIGILNQSRHEYKKQTRRNLGTGVPA